MFAYDSSSSAVSYDRGSGFVPDAFAQFYDKGEFTDAKLASSHPDDSGICINCHRVILAAVSAPLKRK